MCAIEESEAELPAHAKWVNKEYVPGEGHRTIIEAVGILEVNCGVLDVVAREQKQFSLSVEFKSLRWLVHLVSSLQILVCTLGQLSLVCVNNLMQVVHLSERSGRILTHDWCFLVGRNHHHGVSLEKHLLSSTHSKGLQHFYKFIINQLA